MWPQVFLSMRKVSCYVEGRKEKEGEGEKVRVHQHITFLGAVCFSTPPHLPSGIQFRLEFITEPAIKLSTKMPATDALRKYYPTLGHIAAVT